MYSDMLHVVENNFNCLTKILVITILLFSFLILKSSKKQSRQLIIIKFINKVSTFIIDPILLKSIYDFLEILLEY